MVNFNVFKKQLVLYFEIIKSLEIAKCLYQNEKVYPDYQIHQYY